MSLITLGTLSVVGVYNSLRQGQITRGLTIDSAAVFGAANPATPASVAIYMFYEHVLGVRFEDAPAMKDDVVEGYNWLMKHFNITQEALDKFWWGGFVKWHFAVKGTAPKMVTSTGMGPLTYTPTVTTTLAAPGVGLWRM